MCRDVNVQKIKFGRDVELAVTEKALRRRNENVTLSKGQNSVETSNSLNGIGRDVDIHQAMKNRSRRRNRNYRSRRRSRNNRSRRRNRNYRSRRRSCKNWSRRRRIPSDEKSHPENSVETSKRKIASRRRNAKQRRDVKVDRDVRQSITNSVETSKHTRR